MRVSYSKISTYLQCPYKFDLKYNQELETIFNCDPQNALILGHALHTCIEKGLEAGINEYYTAYPVIDDLHINEAIKLQYLVPKVLAILSEGEYEVKIGDDDYVGYIDLLVPTDRADEFDIFDFKYSNNISNYLNSGQLHLYKYYFEKSNPGKKIRNLYFLFIPKTLVRQKKTESLTEFRKRIVETLEAKEICIKKIEYDPNKVIEFLTNTKHCIEASAYPKNHTNLCDFCEYKNYCEKGEIIEMLLPKNERRSIEQVNKRKLWIYGSAFVGKTTFANQFPDPLMLNTDGNITFVDAPYLPIKDDVKIEGRQTKRTFAWEVFKEIIAELEKKDNTFKTIVIDLLEDTYEYCRIYMYDKLGIEHESDNSFKAWDMVRTEYLSTIKRLMNLNYENIILISHEDSSKDLTRRSGDKITTIKPNIPDKLANKIAGMVDIVGRVVANDDGNRILSFKSNEVIFGGGRLHMTIDEILLGYEAFTKVYDTVNKKVKPETISETPKTEANVNTSTAEENVSETTTATQTAEEIEPAKKTRKRRV